MRSFLIRLYPPRWRARYGDEFAAILEERPLGPFDVADILLGALDAQLRLRRVGTDIATKRSFSMSLRIGGYAAVLGGVLTPIAIALGTGMVWDVAPVVPGILFISGLAALLVALAGLSAFQARVHPFLSWAAVAVTALGMLVVVAGIVGMQLGGDGFWDVSVLGMLGALVGSSLFAIATYRTAALSRRAAWMVGVASVLTIVAGFGGNILGPVPLFVTTIGFALGWFMLGIDAIRLDRPATAPRPA